MIDVTGVDLVKLAQKVYELSVPQGLGILHFTPKPLSEEEAKSCIYDGILNMDYVHGRACKFYVRKNNEKLEVKDSWYDHTDEQFKDLLSRHNIKIEQTHNHGISCACSDCKAKG